MPELVTRAKDLSIIARLDLLGNCILRYPNTVLPVHMSRSTTYIHD